MAGNLLTTYLNDHLAGSVAALELLDHLIEQHPGSGRDELARIRVEVQEDQDVLRQILDTLGAQESPVRKAAAWVAEKLGQVKLRIDDQGPGDLRVLEALEALALGIQGKLALWRALVAAGSAAPGLAGIDLPRLQHRAERQFEQVERLRLQAARVALRL